MVQESGQADLIVKFNYMSLLTLPQYLDILMAESFDNKTILETRWESKEVRAGRKRQAAIAKILADPSLTEPERIAQVREVEEQYKRGEFEEPDPDYGDKVVSAVDDRRRKLARVRYDMIEKLKDIAQMQHEASKLGLDAFMKNAVVEKIGEKRYEEINRWSDPDEVKAAVQAKKDSGASPVEVKQYERDLKWKGSPSVDEIELIRSAFDEKIRPQIKHHVNEFDALKSSDKEVADILDGVNPHSEIKLDYYDATKVGPGAPSGIRKTEVLDPNTRLSARIKQFSLALARTHNSLSEKIKKEFHRILKLLHTKMENTSEEFLGGEKNASQRMYTATQYALYKVAPLLNIKVQENEATALQKQRDEEAKRLEDEKKAAEKKAKEEEEAALRLARLQLSKDDLEAKKARREALAAKRAAKAAAPPKPPKAPKANKKKASKMKPIDDLDPIKVALS